MPSEIDDIFSAKSSSSKKALTTTSSSSKKTSIPSSSSKAPPSSAHSNATPSSSTSKSKKRKATPSFTSTSVDIADVASQPSKKSKPSKTKRREVQVTHDPSTVVPSSSSAAAKKSGCKKPTSKLESYGVEKQNELEDFMDSRGSSRKRTDDGLLIYSEAELKIGQGGDTPLCPFDCDCCF